MFQFIVRYDRLRFAISFRLDRVYVHTRKRCIGENSFYEKHEGREKESWTRNRERGGYEDDDKREDDCESNLITYSGFSSLGIYCDEWKKKEIKKGKKRKRRKKEKRNRTREMEMEEERKE